MTTVVTALHKDIMEWFYDVASVAAIDSLLLRVLDIVQVFLYDLSSGSYVVAVIIVEESVCTGEVPGIAVGLSADHDTVHGIGSVELPKMQLNTSSY